MKSRLPLGAVDLPGTSRNYHTGQWRLHRPVVHPERCNGCGMCDLYCPDAAVKVVERNGGGRVAEVDLVYCKGCGICGVECPRGAVEMVPEQDAKEAGL